MEQAIQFRIFLALIFISAFTLSGSYRRQARKGGETIPRRAEGGWTLFGRLALVLPLLGSILAYIFHPTWMDWASFSVLDWVRWVGVVLGLICLILIVWVFRSIGSNISETVLTKQAHELVTLGPYRWVRHPLYSTAFLLLLSFALIAASWVIALFGLLGLIVFRWVVIPAEERNLRDKFGTAYEDYQRRTGAMIPGLK